MRKYILSKNYKNTNSAGNKAKTDIERILVQDGFEYACHPPAYYQNAFSGFLATLRIICGLPFRLSKGDMLVVQYPYKKYYTLICRLAHWRSAKVITVIHDLGSFRRKKLTVNKEVKRLSQADFLIVHNDKMKKWLASNGSVVPACSLGIFDYLSGTRPEQMGKPDHGSYKVMYAGGLSYRKNRFLYLLDPIIRKWQFNLYGNGFEPERIINKDKFTYKGFTPSDELIRTANSHFGLVWDGESTKGCEGDFGEYLKYNNPHKTSLYFRCRVPVIIWKKAALASFITQHKAGICVDDLEELNGILANLSKGEYQEMLNNVKEIDARLASGYYIKKAVQQAISFLTRE